MDICPYWGFVMNEDMNINVIRFFEELPVTTTAYNDVVTIIESGAKITLSSDFPKGEMVFIQSPGEKPQQIDTYKLVETLVYQTSKIYALEDGGSVSSWHRDLLSHFSYNTGLCEHWRE